MTNSEDLLKMPWTGAALVGAIRHQCCAEAQRDWFYHQGYYGFVFERADDIRTAEIHKHDHHPRCCEIVEGIHIPKTNFEQITVPEIVAAAQL